MGLYLCVFKGDDELEGVEVGSYADFHEFRDCVRQVTEKRRLGPTCPTLMNHSDSDGEWSPSEAAALLTELELIEGLFSNSPPIELNSPWKKDVAKIVGIRPDNLLDCFFDIDGEPLVARLKELVAASISSDSPILFQ